MDFAVIGEMVDHSWSPKMMQAAFDHLNLPLTYGHVRVTEATFEADIARLAGEGVRGLSVTTPLKARALMWAREATPEAQRAQAANTLDLRLGRAHTTDGAGVVGALRWLGVPPPEPVLVLGAGGAARAAILALHDSGYPVRVWNRTRAKADALAQWAEVLGEPKLEGVGAVIQATTAHRGGAPLPLDWSQASPACLAMDMAYGEAPTEFVRAARARGLRASDGRVMLVEQGVEALRFWLGEPGPREAMHRAVGSPVPAR